MKMDPLNVTCWKHKWCFHNRGVTWDTPLARWAGSEEDWIQKWRAGPPRKAEVIPTLVLATHLSTLQVKKADGGIPLRKERVLDPLMIEPPRTVEGIELVIRGDSKTVVDWINGKAKQKVSYRSIETIQIQLMEWWKRGVDLKKGSAIGRCTSSGNTTLRQIYGRVTGPRGTVRNGKTSLRSIGPK